MFVRNLLHPSRRLRRGSWLLAGSLAALAAPVLAAEPEPTSSTDAPATTAADPWAYTLELYGYLPWAKGTTTIRGFAADTDLAPGQALNLLQSAASVRASAERDRIGLLVDVAYTQLGDEQATTSRRGLFTGRVEQTVINGIYDLALRYRFGERQAAKGRAGSWWVIPYAGVRVVQADLALDAEVRGNGPLGLRWQKEGRLNRTWAQPLLGTQASLFLSRDLRVFGRADVGGFGLAGAQDLTGNAQLGVGYAVGNNTDLNLSWRYFGQAFNNGAARANGFTSYQNGIELGLTFFF